MLKPLYDRVLLEKVKAETTTASGIILPEATEEPSLARVVAVGDGARDDKGELIPMDVKVDDLVVYKKYATTEITYKDVDYLIIDMKDILAIVKDDE
ncbi:MAG TPA: co-chaperone GroES [Erysipelothrix sp.]